MKVKKSILMVKTSLKQPKIKTISKVMKQILWRHCQKPQLRAQKYLTRRFLSPKRINRLVKLERHLSDTKDILYSIESFEEKTSSLPLIMKVKIQLWFKIWLQYIKPFWNNQLKASTDSKAPNYVVKYSVKAFNQIARQESKNFWSKSY